MNGVSGVIDWTRLEIDAKNDDVITIVYKKDSSGNKNDDCVYIRSFAAGAPTIITLHANNGTDETATQNIYCGKGVLNANTFTCEGKLFAGWATSADGEIVYADKATIETEEAMDLYAVWANAVTVTFNYNYGTTKDKTVAIAKSTQIGATNIPDAVIRAPEQEYTRMLVDAARLHTAPAEEVEAGEELLRVEHLKKYFDVKKKNKKLSLKAVDDVSFTLNKGEVLGIVGESGCGKSTLVNTILNLYDPTDGKVYFDGKDVFSDERKNRNAFKKNVQIVFQDPYWSLNPRWLVKEIVAEPLDAYEKLHGQERLARVVQLLEMVGLSRDDAHKYPHEFSGGERQRIAIARSLASNPKLVVLDEPTSSIDVFSQAQILELLRELKEKFQLTNILISHDLGVVSQMANKIAVMYLGKIAEFGPAAEVFRNPQHPYTKALFNAIPKFEKLGIDQLTTLEGAIPSPINPPSGCAFHTRCAEACEECKSWTPEPIYLNDAHYVSCIHFAKQQGEGKCEKI